MAEEPECWEKYGFPDPHLCPPYLPLEGLKKAIIERGGSFRNFPEQFRPMYAESAMQSIDNAIRNLIRDVYFLNPAKLDAIEDYMISDQEFKWTWEDLLLAGADGIEEDIIETDDPMIIGHSTRGLKFGPQLPVRYLIQRYKMINLLKYQSISCEYDNVTGRDYDPDSSATLNERYLRIVPNLQPDQSYHGEQPFAELQVGSYYTYVFLSLTRSCRPAFPQGISGRNASYLIGYYRPWYSHTQLALSGGVIDHWGWNFHKADKDGVFFHFDFNNVQTLFDYAGWYSDFWYRGVFTDYSELYKFKEEEAIS